MNKYYQMTPKTCFLCKDSDGKVFDETQKVGELIDCNHKIDAGVMELQIRETEELLRDLKKSKRYAKIIEE